MSPGRKSVVKNYCKPDIAVKEAGFDKKTGLVDMADLKAKLSSKTAAVYFENPSYLGTIELNAEEICKAAKAAGALIIVGVDPTSLGILEAPGNYGADYAVGDLQPLGLHMSYGGGLGGFICTHDTKEFLGEYPSLLFGICETSKEGEYGFGEVYYERTSYASREKGKDFIGTCAALHGIVAGVYMALMGPQGFQEMGEGIMQRVAYAKAELSKIPGVKIPFDCPSYCDFLVNFDGTGKTVAAVNKALLACNIFGGKDVSKDFAVGQSALCSITEVHDKEDIDRLIAALKEICR
jgi:glycine dehydrogenase subunit 1